MQVRTRKIKLHLTQQKFRQSDAIYRAFVGGRGAGKSWIGAYDLISKSRKDCTYLVGSPTGVMMGDTTYPTFKTLAEELDLWWKVKLSPYPNATLANGAEIRFRTAEDPDKMRGPNLSGAWLDEASLMAEEAYTIVIGALREHGKQGWLTATMTPKGQYHWTYEIFAKNKPNVELFRAHTRENPFNPPGFSDTLEGQYTSTLARQELGGEFLDIEGAEWGVQYFPESAWFDEWPDGLYHLVIALDPSKGPSDSPTRKRPDSGDYSALVAVARDKNGVLWIDADLEKRDIQKMVRDGIAFARRMEQECKCTLEGFGIEGDAFQFLLQEPFAQASRNTGAPLPLYKVFSGGVQKEVRIRRLTPYLVQGKMRFRRTPGCKLLVQQAREFPVGDHDDAIDSCEMAIRLGNDLANKKYGRK